MPLALCRPHRPRMSGRERRNDPAMRDRPFDGRFASVERKSRAEGAARDLKGGELIKTVLDAKTFPVSASRVYHGVVSESRYLCE